MLLDPQAFQRCFMNWVNALHVLTSGQVIALDGKCLRGTQDRRAGKEALYMVSARAAEDHLVLGQCKVDTKSNEITAIPELLTLLDVTGCIVSVDALNCQKNTARQIVQQGGDYLLAVKDNQRHMREDVENLFAWAADGDFAEMVHDQHTTSGKGHGRIETRTCSTLSDPECLAMLGHLEAWENCARWFTCTPSGKSGMPSRTSNSQYERGRVKWGPHLHRDSHEEQGAADG